MERQYIGLVTSPTISDTTNITLALSTEVYNFGILNNSIKNYNFTEDRVFPYIVGTSSTVSSASTTSISISAPSNQEGDLLLMFFAGGANSRTFSSVGWTTEKSSTTPSLALFSKVATSSESNYTITISGGTSTVKGAAISIRNWNTNVFGDFTASSANDPTVSVPDDASSRKLLLFFFGGSSTGQDCDISTISEFELYFSSATACSMDISGIYRTSPNTSLSYTATNSGGNTSNKASAVVIT